MKPRLRMILAVLPALLAASCGPREAALQPPKAPPEPPKIVSDQLRMARVFGEGQAAIADFRGQVLLVVFLAGASDECRAEIAGLNALAADMHGRPFALLGITMDLKPQIYVKEDLRYAQPNFPCVLGDKPARQAFPSVRALPTKWLYDRAGSVAKRYEGAVSLTQIRADIDELMK